MSATTEMTELEPERMWTVQDVARFFSLSLSWVYLHVGQGDLPYRRIGGLIRFFPEEVKAYARGEARSAIPVMPLRPRAS